MERPSSWAAGLGLGLCVAGWLMVNVAKGEWPAGWWGVPLLAGLSCLGAVPFGEYILRMIGGGISALGEAWAQADAARGSGQDDGGDDAAPLQTPLVGGVLLDEWEAAHRENLFAFVQHARDCESLTSTVLVGVAVRKREAWVYYTDILDASGWVDKQNGVATERKDGCTWTYMLRQIANMKFECPIEYKGSPAPPPVMPYRPAQAAGKVNVGKVQNVA